MTIDRLLRLLRALDRFFRPVDFRDLTSPLHQRFVNRLNAPGYLNQQRINAGHPLGFGFLNARKENTP